MGVVALLCLRWFIWPDNGVQCRQGSVQSEHLEDMIVEKRCRESVNGLQWQVRC
jgi:hypothetical protein